MCRAIARPTAWFLNWAAPAAETQSGEEQAAAVVLPLAAPWQAGMLPEALTHLGDGLLLLALLLQTSRLAGRLALPASLLHLLLSASFKGIYALHLSKMDGTQPRALWGRRAAFVARTEPASLRWRCYTLQQHERRRQSGCSAASAPHGERFMCRIQAESFKEVQAWSVHFEGTLQAA